MSLWGIKQKIILFDLLKLFFSSQHPVASIDDTFSSFFIRPASR